MKNIRKYLCEMLGTAVMVLFGCGTAAIGNSYGLGNLGIAVAFGLIVMAMVYTIGPVSGCHINPAVSIAMWINRRIGAVDFLAYVLSQIVGAIMGSALLAFFLSFFGRDTALMGQNLVGELGLLGGLCVEAVLTYVFVLVVMGASGKNGAGGASGIVIGLALCFIYIFGIPFTGASVNPARSIAPALFAQGDAIKQLWVFIVGPILGGALAAVTAKYLLKSEE